MNTAPVHSGRVTLECLPCGARFELRIKSARPVESYLSWNYPAEAQPLSVLQSRGIEPRGLSTVTIRVIHIVRVGCPPVASETDYANAHESVASSNPCTSARAWMV